MARSFSRQALPIVAAVFVACCIIQVFLAGLGVFDDPRSFVTHRFSLDQIEEAYDLFGHQRDRVIKVAISPSM